MIITSLKQKPPSSSVFYPGWTQYGLKAVGWAWAWHYPASSSQKLADLVENLAG
jgi:hypothetical protein